MSEPVMIGRPLSLSDLEDVALRGRKVTLAPDALAAMRRSRAAVDAIAKEGDGARRVYGINTGFGALSETRISASDVRALQKNLVRSHSTGVGPALGVAHVRGIMLLRAQVLALGCSGVRPETVDILVDMLNKAVHPRIPAQGSVGASGDLAPLAHLALAMIGEGEVTDGASLVPSAEAMRAKGITPVVLEAKEGLALINGTQYMASLGTLALLEAERLCTVADIAGAMSLEALKGSDAPFDARLQAARPHPGQAAVAKNLRALLAESEIMESHKDCGKVQDAYSLRCMPAVHGATRDALSWVRQVLEREVNSVTDNPSVFLRDDGGADIVSGGNFHGQPLALALDLAAMAVAELANISERRVEQLVNPALSTGLTPFLAPAGPMSGLHSGFMIAQVASASLVSENKVYCHPASVDSIPSSAGKEDHVSMGSISAKKLLSVVENVKNALAIELMTAAAGVDQRAPLAPSSGVAAAHATLRGKVAPMTEDRPLYGDIEAVARLIDDGSLVASAAERIGALA